MEKDDHFRHIEKILYEFKTYPLAIKNLKEDINLHEMPSCISNYSGDPVSYTVGNPSDSTYNHAVKRVESEELNEMRIRLEEKQRNYDRICEVLELFNEEEAILWNRRYLNDEDVAVIYDSELWAKSTYFRIRKGLVLKVRLCLGEI